MVPSPSTHTDFVVLTGFDADSLHFSANGIGSVALSADV